MLYKDVITQGNKIMLQANIVNSVVLIITINHWYCEGLHEPLRRHFCFPVLVITHIGCKDNQNQRQSKNWIAAVFSQNEHYLTFKSPL